MHQNACGAARKVNPPKQKQACMAGLFLILYQSGRSIGGGALEGELCLLAVSGVLMDDALACRFIHSAHSLQKCCFCGCCIPCCQRLIIPLDGGFDRGIHHTVAQILLRGNTDPFLGGFDVCQMIHPLSYRCLFGCPTKAKPFARTNEIIPCSFALCKTFLSWNPAEIRRPAGYAAMPPFFRAHPRHSDWNVLAGMRKWIYDNANGGTAPGNAATCFIRNASLCRTVKRSTDEKRYPSGSSSGCTGGRIFYVPQAEFCCGTVNIRAESLV